MTTTVRDDILGRIRSQGRRKVFIAKDFLDLGSRDVATPSLSRLVKISDILRPGRGLYDCLRMNDRPPVKQVYKRRQFHYIADGFHRRNRATHHAE